MSTLATFALNAASWSATSADAFSPGRIVYVAGNMNPSMFRWWP